VKESKQSIIGKGVARVDAKEKSRGEAKYVNDINLPGMLYAAVLKSPHAHARILSIDTRQALSLPGVKGVITGQDILDRKFCIVSGSFPARQLCPCQKQPCTKITVLYFGITISGVPG